MKIKVKKTDKRHTGHGRFAYYVDIQRDNWQENTSVKEKFFELRLWCWETWGPGRELDHFAATDKETPIDQNNKWSWINDQYRCRLYLGSLEEAAYFTLKWS